MSTFNKYFQDELTFLRELGHEFSQAYPALAPMLADRGADPDVERLLEGVAFLTGRIRQKLDDELPEVIVAIATLLFPHLVRPLPGCTILEIVPAGAGAGERVMVPRGTEFASIDVEGTSCTFSACSSLELTPLLLEDARLEALPEGKQELRLRLSSMSGQAIGEVAPETLRLYFAGDLQDALRLCMWVQTNVEDVALVERTAAGKVIREVPLGRGAINPVGYAEDEALLPAGRATFPGFRLLEEYYTLPQKFAFIDVRRFREAAASLTGQGPEVSLSIRLSRRLLEAAPVSRDSVRLHCLPIANVFRTTAEPVRLSPTRERFLVRPAGLSAKHGEIYEIERVSAIERASGRRIEIPSFFTFSHGDRASQTGVFYAVHHMPSVVGSGVDVYASFGTPVDVNALPDSDSVSIDVLATNRGIASQLRAGEVRRATSTSPAGASFRNLIAVTSHVPPPFGRELHWRVVAHAAMGVRSLTEIDVLRSVLDVYNLPAIVDRQAARANELRLRALRAVNVVPYERLHRGAPVRGIDIGVDIDEEGFAGEGDLYLFGSILERFFGHYVSLNSFSRTTVTGTTSKVRYQWPPRSGSLTLL